MAKLKEKKKKIYTAGFTIFNTAEVSNSGQKKYTKENVYNVQFINETTKAIKVRDQHTGEFVIPAGKNREWKGHPYFPSDFSVEIGFDTTADPTDFLTIITAQSYGLHSEKCAI